MRTVSPSQGVDADASDKGVETVLRICVDGFAGRRALGRTDPPSYFSANQNGRDSDDNTSPPLMGGSTVQFRL